MYLIPKSLRVKCILFPQSMSKGDLFHDFDSHKPYNFMFISGFISAISSSKIIVRGSYFAQNDHNKDIFLKSHQRML